MVVLAVLYLTFFSRTRVSVSQGLSRSSLPFHPLWTQIPSPRVGKCVVIPPSNSDGNLLLPSSSLFFPTPENLFLFALWACARRGVVFTVCPTILQLVLNGHCGFIYLWGTQGWFAKRKCVTEGSKTFQHEAQITRITFGKSIDSEVQSV